MSQKITLVCDVCGTDKEVETAVFSRKGSKTVEIDMCPRCWDRGLAPIKRKLRPSTRVAGRPQVRFRMTELPPQPGDDEATQPAG